MSIRPSGERRGLVCFERILTSVVKDGSPRSLTTRQDDPQTSTTLLVTEVVASFSSTGQDPPISGEYSAIGEHPAWG